LISSVFDHKLIEELYALEMRLLREVKVSAAAVAAAASLGCL